MDLDSYYHNQILRWAAYVAQMPMTRAPRQLLTGWVAHSRPNGCPEMKWGRALKVGSKVQRSPGKLQEMACHNRGYVGVEIANVLVLETQEMACHNRGYVGVEIANVLVLETHSSFRELILKCS
jgi:hypothetical protein